MQIDHKVAQLLVSRVCHDLAGGIGALSAGVELLGEDPHMADDEALSVIALSARQSTARLAFFRVAFGLGGGENEAISSEHLHTLAENYVHGGRVTLVWRAAVERVALAAGKLLLNMILIAVESLPRGGCVRVDVTEVEGMLGFAVAAQGPGAVLRPETLAAMRIDADAAALSARTVHGYFATLLAASLNADMEYVPAQDGEIRLAAIM